MAIDFPSNPTNGQVYANYIYDSSITAWRNVNTDIGIGTLNAMGLKNVVPTSVVVGSGSASTNSNGTVTFSAATSVSLNGVFTSTYSRYRAVLHVSGSANAELYAKFRIAGTDKSTGYYGICIWNVYNGTVYSANGRNNGSEGWVVATGGSPAQSALEITTRAGGSSWTTFDFSENYGAFGLGGYSTFTATMPDGFTFYPTSGNISGTITIYGYNQ